MSWRRRAFAIFQLLFSAFVFLGSTFEVVNLLFPSVVPAIQDVPLMRLHRSEPVLYLWTVGSNAITALLAIFLVSGAVGVLRGNVAASHSSRVAIKVFAMIVIGAAVISAVYLAPPIRDMLADEGQRTLGTIMLVSVSSALGGLAVILAGLYAGHGAILRRGPSADA